jgi:hypothetical protein
MKKLLLGAFIFGCTALGFGQSKEEVRATLAKEMATLVQNTKYEYGNTTSYEDFKSKLMNSDQAKTTEGEDLLKRIYSFHVDQTSTEKITSEYDGLEIAKAFEKVSALEKSGIDTKEGMTIFSSDPNTENASSESGYPCKWWQLRCHLVQVVGETAADAIITAAIALLLL